MTAIQNSAAAESMKEQAQGLAQAVSVFRLGESAQSAQPNLAPVPQRAGERARGTNTRSTAKIRSLPVRKAQGGKPGPAAALPKAVGAGGEWAEF
jgi:methyl-accepting chemotaxis protein